MTNHSVWLIHTIHPFVWLFLNTAIVFLIDFKSDIYLDSLSTNHAMFFILRTCKLCHCIAQLEHRNKTNQLPWEKIFFLMNSNNRADNKSKRNWLTTSNLAITKMLEKMLTALFRMSQLSRLLLHKIRKQSK